MSEYIYKVNENPLGLNKNNALPETERKALKALFVGGPLNGKEIIVSDLERNYAALITGYTEYEGIHRAELLAAPKIKGYLGPMYDGEQHPLRYETKEMYDIISM